MLVMMMLYDAQMMMMRSLTAIMLMLTMRMSTIFHADMLALSPHLNDDDAHVDDDDSGDADSDDDVPR